MVGEFACGCLSAGLKPCIVSFGNLLARLVVLRGSYEGVESVNSALGMSERLQAQLIRSLTPQQHRHPRRVSRRAVVRIEAGWIFRCVFQGSINRPHRYLILIPLHLSSAVSSRLRICAVKYVEMQVYVQNKPEARSTQELLKFARFWSLKSRRQRSTYDLVFQK